MDLEKWVWQRRAIRLVLYTLGTILAIVTAQEALFKPAAFKVPGAAPVLLAASLSWLVVTMIRLAEGRYSLEFGRVVYSGARATAMLWLTSFVLLIIAIFAFSILEMTPRPLWNSQPVAVPNCPKGTPAGPEHASGKSNPPGAGPAAPADASASGKKSQVQD
ncbi:hypothetical protein [Phenylobacterium sp.]|uniref:hypothetical protein n=1 Tax=Phenylobacterium sp. TaxID=1871053 RepID=UPI0011FE3355|nr:hypothetical protein [Phenylobacterium sp.]THD61614.1 MAG: hypothetical protein E8A49_11630 [Phenylobacterium sp.]